MTKKWLYILSPFRIVIALLWIAFWVIIFSGFQAETAGPLTSLVLLPIIFYFLLIDFILRIYIKEEKTFLLLFIEILILIVTILLFKA